MRALLAVSTPSATASFPMTEHRRHTIPKPFERDAWLAARAPFIGASEVPALMGASPYLAAGDLALIKLGKLQQRETAAMRRGNLLEDVIARWWSAEREIEIAEVPELHVVDGVLVATLDRMVIGRPEALECKSTAHHLIEPLPEWWWQVQAQAVAADLARVHIAALDGTLTFRHWTVERDRDAGERIIEACTAFKAYIDAGEVPPDAPVSYATAQSLHPVPNGERVELPNRARPILSSLHLVQQRLGALQLEADRLKGMLTATLGDASEGAIEGELVCTWRAVTTRSIDGKALRADMPNVAAKYEKTSTTRRLLLK